jgi:hypothetical protein
MDDLGNYTLEDTFIISSVLTVIFRQDIIRPATKWAFALLCDYD